MNKAGCSLSPLLFNIILDALATAIRQEEEIKGIWIGKEEVKLSLFTDVMTLYIENSKDYTKRILDLINEFVKEVIYKINIQISMVFLHINNELLDMENKKMILFTIGTTKRYLEINLTSEVQDLSSIHWRKK